MPLAITHATTIRRLSNLALLAFIGLSVGGQAQSVATRLLARVRAARLDYQGTCIQLTCSIGLARWHGPQDSLKALLNRADALPYQAKQQGRDRAIGEPSRPPAQLPVCA